MKKKNKFKTLIRTLYFLFLFGTPFTVLSQEKPLPKAKTNDFWNHFQLGGGFGLGIGNDFTNITLAPSAIYNFNEHFALGTGLQYSYLKQKRYYSSNVIGGSIIGLFNPIDAIQLSLEVEEVNVSNTYEDLGGNLKTNFWNTGLYLGAGYRSGNATIGARYNVLFDKNKDVYGEAFMPFIRVYF